LSTPFSKKIKIFLCKKKELPGQHYYCPGGEGGKKRWEKEENPPSYLQLLHFH